MPWFRPWFNDLGWTFEYNHFWENVACFTSSISQGTLFLFILMFFFDAHSQHISHKISVRLTNWVIFWLNTQGSTLQLAAITFALAFPLFPFVFCPCNFMFTVLSKLCKGPNMIGMFPQIFAFRIKNAKWRSLCWSNRSYQNFWRTVGGAGRNNFVQWTE